MYIVRISHWYSLFLYAHFVHIMVNPICMYIWYMYVHIVDKKLQNYSLQLIEFKESDWPFCSTIFISIICFLMVLQLYVLVSFLLSLYAEPPILISTFIRMYYVFV